LRTEINLMVVYLHHMYVFIV